MGYDPLMRVFVLNVIVGCDPLMRVFDLNVIVDLFHNLSSLKDEIPHQVHDDLQSVQNDLQLARHDKKRRSRTTYSKNSLIP